MLQAVREFRHILGAGIGHLEGSSLVPADHNIAMCWVRVAYIVSLCVCARYIVVWTCAEVANCSPARVENRWQRGSNSGSRGSS